MKKRIKFSENIGVYVVWNSRRIILYVYVYFGLFHEKHRMVLLTVITELTIILAVKFHTFCDESIENYPRAQCFVFHVHKALQCVNTFSDWCYLFVLATYEYI